MVLPRMRSGESPPRLTTANPGIEGGETAINTTQLAGQTADAQHEVVIIGVGFSGLAMLEALRARNIEAILLEASDELGGAWSSNRYPGVRTDCESRYYCLSLSQKVTDTWDELVSLKNGDFPTQRQHNWRVSA